MCQSCPKQYSESLLPLIEPHIVLDEQQNLIWEQGRPERSCEVYILEGHSVDP